jgi:hypothetical protein
MYAYKVSTLSPKLFADPFVAISFASGVAHECDNWLVGNIGILAKALEADGEVTLKGDSGTCRVKRLLIEE